MMKVEQPPEGSGWEHFHRVVHVNGNSRCLTISASFRDTHRPPIKSDSFIYVSPMGFTDFRAV